MATARRRTRVGVAATALALLGLALAGCAGSVDVERPVGIGSTPNTLKSSPCACIELPNAARG